MIYDKEWRHCKRTKFNHPAGLITFQNRTETKKPRSTLDGIVKQIRYFTMNIHGVPYIWENKFRFTVRIFWFLVVAAAIISCFAMFLALSSHHDKRQLKTVVATAQMPIYSINFPAVALCSWNKVNWLRYKAAENKFLPSNSNNKTKQLFYDILRILNEMELSEMDNLALLENRTVDRVIGKIPLNDLVSFMAFRCAELFVQCLYDETEYDCCTLFVAERTQKGVCMVFNSMVTEQAKLKQINDKFYPWKNRKAGERTGLQFTLRYNEKFKRPGSQIKFGIDVMVKRSDEWSTSFTNSFVGNTKNYLSITPIISETSTKTRHLEPLKRNCLFQDEKSERYNRIEGLIFNKFNCMVKCQQTSLIQICNCSLTWFFPKIDARDCTVADLICIYENRDIFTYIKSPLQDDYIMDTRRGIVCDCIDSCTSLMFLTSLNVNRLANPNISFPMIEADIYIGQRVVTKYETRLYSTTFDLIAKFGGILGLCLGASVLSLAELAYAFLKIIIFLFVKLFQNSKVKPQANKKFNTKSKRILS